MDSIQLAVLAFRVDNCQIQKENLMMGFTAICSELAMPSGYHKAFPAVSGQVADPCGSTGDVLSQSRIQSPEERNCWERDQHKKANRGQKTQQKESIKETQHIECLTLSHLRHGPHGPPGPPGPGGPGSLGPDLQGQET